ncbi:MAG: DUF2341 domain-containing protein [Candidatus Thermoplasmatota archaeon]
MDLAQKAKNDASDVVFTNESNIKLPHEIEYYNHENGHLIAWINITKLQKNRDAFLMLYYGNPNAENQQNIEGVWDSNYVMIQHLNETTGSTILDSTSYNNDGTSNGDASLNQTGKIDGAYNFNTNTDYIEVPTSTTLNITGSLTMELWIKNTPGEEPTTRTILNKTRDAYTIELDQTGTILTAYINNTPTTTILDGNWHYIALVYNQTSMILYQDGEKINETTKTGSVPTNNQPLILGKGLAGTMDEVRISNTARTYSYIKTIYQNTKNPQIYAQIEPEQNQTQTYLKITIKNMGSRTLNILKSTMLVDGNITSFINLQNYQYPLTEGILLVKTLKKDDTRIKIITDTGGICYAEYPS